MLNADSAPAEADGQQQRANDTEMKDSNGCDGKQKAERNAVITNPEALEDPNYTDEDAPPVEQIEADEGTARDLTGLFFLFQASSFQLAL